LPFGTSSSTTPRFDTSPTIAIFQNPHAYVSAHYVLVGADYYNAPTFRLDVSEHTVVKSDERFYQISFNHRIAFLRTTDADVVG
jgi:hypothetical protein